MNVYIDSHGRLFVDGKEAPGWPAPPWVDLWSRILLPKKQAFVGTRLEHMVAFSSEFDGGDDPEARLFFWHAIELAPEEQRKLARLWGNFCEGNGFGNLCVFGDKYITLAINVTILAAEQVLAVFMNWLWESEVPFQAMIPWTSFKSTYSHAISDERELVASSSTRN